jgi:hypothetical protein
LLSQLDFQQFALRGERRQEKVMCRGVEERNTYKYMHRRE